jgi:D-sedoheptulose 7-phosphate isomerase
MQAANNMTDNEFLEDYFSRYKRALLDTDVRPQLLAFRDLCFSIRQNNAKLMFAGNGASASTASHAAVDFTKQAKVCSTAFNDHNLITALSNDYGYDRWVAEAIKSYAKPGDGVVLISASGNSPNIVRAAEAAAERRLPMITFTGFYKHNAVNRYDGIHFWIDSRAYNIIENVHSIWIATVVDLLMGQAEYTTKDMHI